jgi:hypothetical protein
MQARRFLLFVLLLLTPLQASGKVSIRQKEIPARGAKECTLVELDSELEKEKQREYGLSASRSSSRVPFSVISANEVRLRIMRDLMPGRPIYFLIAGKRYAGTSGSAPRITGAGLSALRKDQPFDVSWYSFPYDNEVPYRDRFDGFQEAFSECVDYLKGKAAQ